MMERRAIIDLSAQRDVVVDVQDYATGSRISRKIFYDHHKANGHGMELYVAGSFIESSCR